MAGLCGIRIEKDPDKETTDNCNQQSQTSPEPLRWLRGRGLGVILFVVVLRTEAGVVALKKRIANSGLRLVSSPAPQKKKQTDRRERLEEEPRDKQPHLHALLGSARIVRGPGWFLCCLSFGYLLFFSSFSFVCSL